jgi:predicted nucleotidyltransferase
MDEAKDRIRAIGERLKKEYNAEKVILFGSHARGEATEDSDVDILIIAQTAERFFQRTATAKRLIRDLRNGLPVAPIVLTREEIEERVNIKDQFIEEILTEGVEL